MPPRPSPRRFRGLLLAALTASAPLAAVAAPLAAQERLPMVEVRQVMNGGSFGFGSAGRAQLDRDAFLVVFELGADNRARVLYPSRPRDNGFARADRPVYVPLPSADAAFIRTAELTVPHIIAFASDLVPDLSQFTRDQRRWDYQYAVSGPQSIERTAAELAELLYGSVDMPYTVATRAMSPQLPTIAQRQLASCGFVSNGFLAPDFNRFLWDLWGPASLLETSFNIDQRYRDFQWYGLAQAANFFPLPWSIPFMRSTSFDLWNRYGASCRPLQPYGFFVAMQPTSVPLPPGEEAPEGQLAPVPGDRELRPPGTVGDVGIVPASPQAMARREAAASRVASARSEQLQARGPLTRESSDDLVRRTDIATTMALLRAERMAGQQGTVMDAFARVRAGQVPGNGTLAATRQGANRLGGATFTRDRGGFEPSRTKVSGSSFGSSSGSGSAGGSAAGSASSSGGSEARGGGASSARGSTGRP